MPSARLASGSWCAALPATGSGKRRKLADGEPRWRRVLLKLSGEAFAGEQRFGIDIPTIRRLAEEIAEAHRLGVELAVVVGGGNIVRGELASAAGLDRTTADQMGMLATVINALTLQDALEKIGCATRTQ